MAAGDFDAVIVGGGVSALAAAWFLYRGGRRVLVACDAARLGGVIRTVREDGWLLEEGPNSYASFGDLEDGLLSDLGLADRALRRPIAKTDRYIWHSGRLHRVPIDPVSFLRSGILPFGARLRILSGLVRRYPPPDDETTIGGFLRGALGDDAVDTLVRPGLAGIYAADADRISLAATLPKVEPHLRTNRRLIGALRSMRAASPRPGGGKRTPRHLTSFPDGLDELPRALESALRAGGVAFATGVDPLIERGSGAAWRVRWRDGSAEASHVIIAAGARGAAALLDTVAPSSAEGLRALEHARLTVVHAGVRVDDVARPLDGFGFLARRDEGVRILGSIWSSAIFPGRAPGGHALLTCFVGGDIDPAGNDLDDGAIRAQVREDLERTIGLRGGDFALFRIRRWDPALPLFRPGHVARIRVVNDGLPAGIRLLGNFQGGISIPDRVRAARGLADEITDGVPRPA